MNLLKIRNGNITQSMFWSKNKKKVYLCKPQFYYIKVWCKGVFVTWTCFRTLNGRRVKSFLSNSEIRNFLSVCHSWKEAV